MKVEVEAQQIAALEQQAQQVGSLLTAVCSTRPKGIRVTQAMLEKAGRVEISQDGDGVLLTWSAE